jgi:ABC-2 type transport system permease protein
MKLLAVFYKSCLEMLRQPLVLALALAFAPFFILLYRLWLPSGSTTYTILVLDQDRPVQSLMAAKEAFRAVEAVTYKDGQALLAVRRVESREEAEKLLRDRRAAALLVFPPEFSSAVAGLRQSADAPPAAYTLVGDLSNPLYAVAAVLAAGAVDSYIQASTGRSSPTRFQEEALGGSGARTEFENYVPGLLVFAVIMLIFPAAMAVAREIESGTLRRLRMTQMRALDLLGGISLAQVLVGMLSIGLSLLTAWCLGFRSQGPLWLAFLVGMLTALSMVALGLVVACFAKTAMQAFLVANFPLALLMFFSGAIYPIPRVGLFSVAGREIGLYDILPATHAVTALNKVMALGASVGDVSYELGALLALTCLYFGLGVWLFQRTQLRAD